MAKQMRPSQNDTVLLGACVAVRVPFPIDPFAPTGANGGDTGSMAFTFMGNFVYLRAVISRDYIQPVNIDTVWQNWQFGSVDTVLLSL